MSEPIEVTEWGEIVARCIEGAAWTEPHPAGHVWLHVEDEANARIVASALLSREDMAAWCRRVLREVDPDAVPLVRDTRTAYSPGEGGASPDILARIADATARVSALTQDERREMLIAALADAAPTEHGGMWPEPCDPVPTLDEAAIRADEAEKIAAYLDAKSDTLLDGRHAILVEERDVTGWNMRAAECDALESAAGDIRAGKHRSTP